MLKENKVKRILKTSRIPNIQNNVLCFLSGDRTPDKTTGEGLKAKIQDFLKNYGALYNFLIEYFSPAYFNFFCRRKIKKLLDQYDEKAVVLNIGSGPAFYLGRKDIINVDIFAFDEVDLVADASDLPIRDKSVDVVINLGVLEHVKDSRMVVQQMFRVLKKGGILIAYLPFIMPFHAAPSDFQRWTAAGVKVFLSDFDEVEVSIGAGPTSGLLWVLQEWLSIILSFGSKTLHDIIFLVLMVLTAPIKLLDFFLVKFPYAENIASGFYVFAKKG